MWTIPLGMWSTNPLVLCLITVCCCHPYTLQLQKISGVLEPRAWTTHRLWSHWMWHLGVLNYLGSMNSCCTICKSCGSRSLFQTPQLRKSFHNFWILTVEVTVNIGNLYQRARVLWLVCACVHIALDAHISLSSQNLNFSIFTFICLLLTILYSCHWI